MIVIKVLNFEIQFLLFLLTQKSSSSIYQNQDKFCVLHQTIYLILPCFTDIADRELSCVGYWMEDMRSYMLTYDEEDAVSRFRCWVSGCNVIISEHYDFKVCIMQLSTHCRYNR